MIVRGRWVVKNSREIIEDGAVAIDKNMIVKVGKYDEIKKLAGRDVEVIGDDKKLVMPGIVNSHTHISMTLLRGYADDLLLQEWLENHIWPYERLMEPEDYELGALLGIAESLASGVTNICTMYHYHPSKSEVTALMKARMRGTVGIAIFSWDAERTLKNFVDAVSKYHNFFNIVSIAASPHAPYTVSPDLWRDTEELRKELNEKYGSPIPIILTTHVAEDWREPALVKERFGVEVPQNSIVKYLDDLGVIGPHFLGAHGIHLTDLDMDILAEKGGKIAHNPVANMKLGMGYADTPRMMDKGINVSLGTDGPASNNTLDMLETMKFAALINKPLKRDPRVTSARDIFKMATENGAKALGYSNLGVIDVGFLADITVIDFDKPHLKPVYDVYSHIVYAVRKSDVYATIVNGKVLYIDGQYTTLDIDDVMHKVERRAYELAEKVRGG